MKSSTYFDFNKRYKLRSKRSITPLIKSYYFKVQKSSTIRNHIRRNLLTHFMTSYLSIIVVGVMRIITFSFCSSYLRLKKRKLSIVSYHVQPPNLKFFFLGYYLKPYLDLSKRKLKQTVQNKRLTNLS